MITIKGAYNSAKIFLDAVDEGTLQQLHELCNQPFVEGLKIRVMPDTHVGMGCTIGTTMTIRDKVVPGHVGVDIGCGVLVGRIPAQQVDFAKLDRVIRGNVPSGFDVRNSPHRLASKARLAELKCAAHIKKMTRIELGIGSLGGGNHFIEVAAREAGDNYLSIHTGSRNLGKQIAEHYQNAAVRALSRKGHGGTKVPKYMAYVEGEDLADYLNDMTIAQEFADLNRKAIAEVISRGMNWELEDVFITTHNYIDAREGILRKGAVAAHKGQILIIPVNMRDGSIIAVGKGNSDWNYSAPHGAGRLLSRSQAKRTYSLAEYRQSMEGIFTTSVDPDTLDEAPMAYKPIRQILDAIGDTVEVQHILKTTYNFKAGGD
ncbi:MAG: RNA-splicing ligase RtcB [Firmicutes bacterium]|nr:RNA-splicing ligase RtcB [candidate division NPL-UPA2 bacterium]MBT9153856.1 RNA-splicing ligase RtcB [candidate division NPL-UPA2 bacterium]MBT9156472.1 RNA-splicing ligase RtcB [candidate division NPL-UPA2 bacterium]